MSRNLSQNKLGITVAVGDPGWCETYLSRGLGIRTAAQGARCIEQLAFTNKMTAKNNNGQLWEYFFKHKNGPQLIHVPWNQHMGAKSYI